MLRRFAKAGLVALGIGVLLASCAEPSHRQFSRQELRTAENPPIVLLSADSQAAEVRLASPRDELLKMILIPAVDIATAPFTLGLSLIKAPLYAAAQGSVLADAQACQQRWTASFGDPRVWFEQTLGGHDLSALLPDEVSRLLKSVPAAPDVITEPLPAGPVPAGRYIAVHTRFQLEQEIGGECGAQVIAEATLEMRAAGMQPGHRQAVRVSEYLGGAEVMSWAAEPSTARARLQRAYTRLAEEIVMAYPWLAATPTFVGLEVSGTRAACRVSLWLGTSGADCSYDTVDQCKRVRSNGACLPRSDLVPKWCFKREDKAASELIYTEPCFADLQPVIEASAAPRVENRVSEQAVSADNNRAMWGFPPDAANALAAADLQGETAAFCIGTLFGYTQRGYLIVTDRSVRFYRVGNSAPDLVMLAPEIGGVTTTEDPPLPYFRSKGSVLTVHWITGDVRTTLRFISPRSPMIGDAAAARAAAEAIGRLAGITPEF